MIKIILQNCLPSVLVFFLFNFIYSDLLAKKANAVSWVKKEFDSGDKNLTYLHFMCRYDIENCNSSTTNPLYR